MKGSFASDNLSGVSPEILEAISSANESKYVIPYGGDTEITRKAMKMISEEVLGVYETKWREREWDHMPGKPKKKRLVGEYPYVDWVKFAQFSGFSVDDALLKVTWDQTPRLEILEKSCQRIPFVPEDYIFFCNSGTGANCLALAALCEKSYEYVICADWAHIHTDECAAPERLADVKIEAVSTTDGKLTKILRLPDGREKVEILPQVEALVKKAKDGFIHRAQPKVISITQPTEYGAVYHQTEIAELASWAHERNMYLHMDGARLSNAVEAMTSSGQCKAEECGLCDLSFLPGVDCLSLGLTKNGGFCMESCIFRPGLFKDFGKKETEKLHSIKHLHKQLGQMNSKTRFISAQFEAMLAKDPKNQVKGDEKKTDYNNVLGSNVNDVHNDSSASSSSSTKKSSKSNEENDGLPPAKRRRLQSDSTESADGLQMDTPLWCRNAKNANDALHRLLKGMRDINVELTKAKLPEEKYILVVIQ